MPSSRLERAAQGDVNCVELEAVVGGRVLEQPSDRTVAGLRMPASFAGVRPRLSLAMRACGYSATRNSCECFILVFGP